MFDNGMTKFERERKSIRSNSLRSSLEMLEDEEADDINQSYIYLAII
jgi:hypothetical protein